jgi:uncharacterized membrane protein YfcA
MPFDDVFLWLLVVFFLAHFTEAIVGFGSTLLVLAFGGVPIKDLLPVLIPMNLTLSSLMTLQSRRDISPILWRQILPWSLLGLPLGMVLYRTLSTQRMQGLFGAILLLVLLWEAFQAFQARRLAKKRLDALVQSAEAEATADIAPASRPLSRWQGRVWLFFGGIVQGLYAAGGPFIVYFTSRQGLDKSAFRATLATLWMILYILLFTTLLVRGEWLPHHQKAYLTALPTVFLGLWLGQRLHRMIREDIFRIAVKILLFFAALRFLLNA